MQSDIRLDSGMTYKQLVDYLNWDFSISGGVPFVFQAHANAGYMHQIQDTDMKFTMNYLYNIEAKGRVKIDKYGE